MDNFDAKSCSSICDRESLAAFAIYLALSLFFFGRGLIGHFGDRYIGVGSDPAAEIYFLNWWPYAITNHKNLFLNRIAWSASTVNMAKNTGMPIAALLLAPISRFAGPVRAYNILILLSPAISAWAAFQLNRRLSGFFFAALAGAALFGFSPFITSHVLGQPVLLAGWFPAFAIYVVLLNLDGEISAKALFVLITLILIGQAGFSLEMVATMTFFGAIALALAYWHGDATLRSRIMSLATPLACAYGATIVILSPYLYYMFVGGRLDISPHLPIYNSATLTNFIVPTPVNALGVTRIERLLAPHTHIYDTSAYIGIPALVLIFLMAFRRGSEPVVRLTVSMLLVLMVLSLGPLVWTGPHSAIPMPEVFIYWFVPILQYALPSRFAAYFFLCIGALFALWMSDHTSSAGVRAGLGALVILSLLPNLNWKFWTIRETMPQFFSDGTYRDYIARNENILILPYGVTGDSDLWQVATRFYFHTSGSYLGLTPAVPKGYRDWPIVDSLYGLNEMPDLDRNLAAFLLNKHVTKVIVPDGAHLWQWTFGDGPASWRLRAFDADEKAAIGAFFGWLDPAPLHIDGVTIYRIPLDRLGAYARDTPEQLQLDAARARTRTLVTAANSYLAQGGDIKRLSLVEAANRGLIPRLWITGPLAANFAERRVLRNGLRLEPRPNRLVEIAIFGTRDALERVERDYRPFYRTARLLPPQPSTNLAEWSQSRLELRFDRAGLAAAATAPAATQ
jgi:hypothetical protein